MNESMEVFDLPSGYTYKLEDNNDIRIQEINDEDAVMEWLEKLKECTKVTWRTARTYKAKGRLNVFKRDFRCQHGTGKRRLKGCRSSKNVDCKATLQIKIKQSANNTKWELADSLASKWPCVVIFRGLHNHNLSTAEVLRYRDMSNETKERLLTLFHLGHSPTSALHYIKTELLLKFGDTYEQVAEDGYYVPSLSRVQKLYKGEFPDKATHPAKNIKRFSQEFHGETSTPTEEMSVLENNSDPYSIYHASPAKKIQKFSKKEFPCGTSIHTEAEISVSENYSEVSGTCHTPPAESSLVLAEEVKVFDDFYAKVKEGLKSKPEAYGPAFKKMVQKIQNFAFTEAGLVTTLRQFGNSGFRGRSVLSRQNHDMPARSVSPSERKIYVSDKTNSETAERPLKRIKRQILTADSGVQNIYVVTI